MSYRTITIKLLRPTEAKKRLMDDAMGRYAQAFEALLRACRPLCRTGAAAKDLCPRSVLPVVDAFGCQPFKDALQQEVQGGCTATWRASKRDIRPIIPSPGRMRKICAGFFRIRAIFPAQKSIQICKSMIR